MMDGGLLVSWWGYHVSFAAMPEVNWSMSCMRFLDMMLPGTIVFMSCQNLSEGVFANNVWIFFFESDSYILQVSIDIHGCFSLLFLFLPGIAIHGNVVHKAINHVVSFCLIELQFSISAKDPEQRMWRCLFELLVLCCHHNLMVDLLSVPLKLSIYFSA